MSAYIMIEGEPYPIDTPEQIRTARDELCANGHTSAAIWQGEPDGKEDSYRTDLRLHIDHGATSEFSADKSLSQEYTRLRTHLRRNGGLNDTEIDQIVFATLQQAAGR